MKFDLWFIIWHERNLINLIWRIWYISCPKSWQVTITLTPRLLLIPIHRIASGDVKHLSSLIFSKDWTLISVKKKALEFFPGQFFKVLCIIFKCGPLLLALCFVKKKIPLSHYYYPYKMPNLVHLRGRSTHILAQWRLQLPRSGELKFELMTHSREVDLTFL